MWETSVLYWLVKYHPLLANWQVVHVAELAGGEHLYDFKNCIAYKDLRYH